MGYFSNGTEGMDYQEQYCSKCIHDEHQDCPVWLLHLMFNYEQHRDGKEALKDVLNALIPRRPDTFNDRCRMFVPFPSRASGVVQRFEKAPTTGGD